MVLLPTATDPPTPMMKGTLPSLRPRNFEDDGIELLGGGHVQIEQARQRQIDLLDLLDRQFLDEAGELLELALLQGHRRVGAQPRPLGAREYPVGRELQVCRIGHGRFFTQELYQGLARWAFSSRPDVPLRRSSTASTSATATPRASSSTSR